MALDFASMFGGSGDSFWGQLANKTLNDKLQNPQGRLSNMVGDAAGSGIQGAFTPTTSTVTNDPAGELMKPVASSPIVNAQAPESKIADKPEPIQPGPPKSDSALSQILKIVVAAIAAA